jgi:hypothetical protein
MNGDFAPEYIIDGSLPNVYRLRLVPPTDFYTMTFISPRLQVLNLVGSGVF